jgi:ubiquitin-conjugating enzyme E2 S
VIRCLLIVPFPESSLNDEAGKLFMESYIEYAKRAKLMADVHGRPASSFTTDNTANTSSSASSSGGADADGNSSTTAKMASADSSNPAHDDRVLKSASDNPLRSSNTTQVKAKKKSLKRL